MPSPGFSLFDTAIGRCGIAWGDRGVAGVQLPEARDSETRARLRSRSPDARESPPPPDVARAIDAIRALLRGEPGDLGAIALDMAGVPDFHRRVYEAARAIPAGETRTYGEIARRLGDAGAARAVGQALGRNPFALVVPCHRVTAANGKPGGFSANGGATTKLRLLEIEGARPAEPPSLLDAARAPGFDADAALAHVRASDAALARVIDAVGPFRMERKETASVFGALAEAIVYQQLAGKAAATIYGRLCAAFPRAARSGPTPRQILGAPDAALRAVGLSRPKQLALRDLAERAHRRTLPTLVELEALDDEAIVEALTQVRGVGRWTAEMFLMFRLGRPDVLPVGDFGIRKGFGIAFRKRELPSPEAVLARGERWRPFRTLASWYLWRATELPQRPRRA